MIERTKVFRRLLVCLIAALAISVAAAPIMQSESGTVWAKSNKKNKKKKKKGFVKESGRWYYYKDGKKQTGWFTVGSRKYYGHKSGSGKKKGELAKGWATVKGKEYYFRTEGKKGVICSAAISGTAKVNGIKCVFDEDGNLVRCKKAGATNTFIEKVGEMARMNQAKNNILASLVVAQACLETGYGSSIYRNNLFGIRAGSGYRAYDSWEASIADYVEFMHTYIPSIFGVRDAYTACAIIGRSGYAEAGGYGSMLSSIVASNNLTRFNE